MNYDAIHHSLEFINTYFSVQVPVYKEPIYAPMKENSMLHTWSGKFTYEYRINSFYIATKLRLFETHLLKDEISKGVSESSNPDEVKKILQNLLKIARKNIEYYEKISAIRYNNGSVNNSYQGIAVKFTTKILKIEDGKGVWIPTKQTFEGEEYKEYKLQHYTNENFYDYSATFYNFVYAQIKDWIIDKELDLKKKIEEIKNLKREKWKFWLGVISGASIATLGWLTLYFTVLRR